MSKEISLLIIFPLLILVFIYTTQTSGKTYIALHPGNLSGCDKAGVNDTCEFHCNEANLESFDCGNSGRCEVYCKTKECMKNGVLNASNSNNGGLYVSSTGLQCFKDGIIELPSADNATLTINRTSGGLDEVTINSGLNTQNIHIDCDGTSKVQDCHRMIINAQNARSLYININGSEYSGEESRSRHAIINCPQNSNYNGNIAPCILYTNGGTLTDVIINTLNGLPYDLWIYNANYNNVQVNCIWPSSQTDIDSNIPINQQTDCFNTYNPTYNPTILPTSNPTFNPSYNPSYNPTSDPTLIPTTSNPTSNPTTSIPTSNPTSNPSDQPTQYPTIIPTPTPTIGIIIKLTAYPTEQPSTSAPISTADTHWITSKIDIGSSFATNEDTSLLDMSSTYVWLIFGSIGLLLCICVCIFLLVRNTIATKRKVELELQAEKLKKVNSVSVKSTKKSYSQRSRIQSVLSVSVVSVISPKEKEDNPKFEPTFAKKKKKKKKKKHKKKKKQNREGIELDIFDVNEGIDDEGKGDNFDFIETRKVTQDYDIDDGGDVDLPPFFNNIDNVAKDVLTPKMDDCIDNDIVNNDMDIDDDMNTCDIVVTKGGQ